MQYLLLTEIPFAENSVFFMQFKFTGKPIDNFFVHRKNGLNIFI